MVAIGIDRYTSWPALGNAASDARGATAAFQRHGFELALRADGSQITPLLDEAATHDAIRSLIARDLKRLTEDDRLVVFFAGHGTTITRALSGHAAKVGYLIPVDAGDHASHEHNWIHLDTLLGEIAWLKPRHILVILDACYTGAVLDAIRSFTRGRGSAENPLASLRTKHSRRIIVSARGDERAADGGADGHSIFTAALVAALARTDRTHLTGDDLASELQRHVREHTDGLQIPTRATSASTAAASWSSTSRVRSTMGAWGSLLALVLMRHQAARPARGSSHPPGHLPHSPPLVQPPGGGSAGSRSPRSPQSCSWATA